MSDVDHRPVQEAESAAAAKTREAMEAILRLLQQRAQQAQESGAGPQAAGADNSPYVPAEQDAQLYQNFFDAYREHGVDPDTAQAAAADAAVGLGAADSPAMQQAETQVIQTVQQAQAYRTAASAAVDPKRSPAERQQADADRKALEKDLWLDDKPVQQRAQIINQLDPPGRQPAQLPDEQLPPEAKTKAESKERFRSNLQDSYEERGARSATAQAASDEVVNKAVGAADGPAVKQVHQEIAQHQILKDLYQGVYEKSGVSPTLATQAADQMARGNGANRSPVVRQAHDQAITNLSAARNVSPEQAPKGTTERAQTNRAPDVGQPVPQKPSPQVQPEQPIPAAQTAQPAVTQPTPENNSPEPTSDAMLWQQHSPTEQGAQLRPAMDYAENSALVDSHFAYNALSAGATVAETKDAILRNSSDANGMEPQDATTYADRVISRANRELSTEQTTTATTEQTAAPVEKNTVTPPQTPTQINQPETETTERPDTDSGRPEAPPEAADSQVKQPLSTASTQPAQPSLSSQQLYSEYGETKNSGVFAAVSKKNARANDLAVAQKALIAGHSFDAVRAAISENSPHAQTLKEPKSYGERTVSSARKTKSFEQAAPGIIWNGFQSSQGQTALADSQIVRSALESGHKHEHIAQAITQNSPVALASEDADGYGKTLVKGEIKAMDEEKLAKQPAKQTNQEKTAGQQKDSKRVSSKQTDQKKQPSKQKTLKKVKSKDQGMEM